MCIRDRYQRRVHGQCSTLQLKENCIMSFRPLSDRILVERVEENEKTKGGIIIPDTAKEKPAEGKVVASGNGRMGEDGKLLPMDVKVGDRVLFSKYGGTEVNVDGIDYLIMRQDDVLGVVDQSLFSPETYYLFQGVRLKLIQTSIKFNEIN
eukprot:TRINITY_DN7510_c0_g1_i2.p1 TRINITY_DN7510_c0_g1~~TRINITY_DN7510_c0_g1_i2.p1  ORF type:complete len:151 (-),score=22.43 TRINITY_DN7510_c0_g1_i2:168-620(-)